MSKTTRTRKSKRCLSCNAELKKTAKKYCNNSCQNDYYYKRYIERWLAGLESGVIGKGFQVSRHIRRWMLETYGEKCSACGWAERHSITGRVPIEVDHIDGDIQNNRPENLRLLCPNCHSLTSTHGILNRGKGKRYNHKAEFLNRRRS